MVGCVRTASRRVVIWQARQHSHLHHGHGLAGFGADHREAKNAVVACSDKRLHKALSFVDGVRPKHGTHREFCDTGFDTLTLRLAFAQSHPCKRGIRKHAERQSTGRGGTCQNDSETASGEFKLGF